MPEVKDTLDLEIPLGIIGRNPKEYLDYKLPGLSTATVEDELDWEKGFMLDPLPNENQGSGGTCTEQAFCYDFCSKHGIDLSRRDGYSRICRPDQAGAMAHEPYWLYDKDGQHTRKNFPDPKPQTEENMRVKIESDISRNTDFKVNFWSPVDYDIDTIARLILKYKGATGCFILTGEGWKDRENPKAPRREDVNWRGSHMLWLRGFKLYKGEKKIYARSSWNGTDHKIGTDYFFKGSDYVHGVYGGEYRKVINTTMEFVVIEKNGKLGVAIFDGGFAESIMWAKDKQQIFDIIKAMGAAMPPLDANGYPKPAYRIVKQ